MTLICRIFLYFDVNMSIYEVPFDIKVKILTYLNKHDFLNATACCTEMRQCFYIHYFWKYSRITIESNQSAVQKLAFLTKFAKHTTSLEFCWRMNTNRSKSSKFNRDNHVASIQYLQTFAKVIASRPKFICLDTLKLQLQNPLCQTNRYINGFHTSSTVSSSPEDDDDFCKVYGLAYVIKKILISSLSNMRYFSSGFNKGILHAHVFDFYLENRDTPLIMNDLHIGTMNTEAVKQASLFSFVSQPVVALFQRLCALKYLTIDWDQMCSRLLQALIDRTNHQPLSQLILIMHKHSQCSQKEKKHPTSLQWQLFVNNNVNLEVCLTFHLLFGGVCSSVKDIRNVCYLKVIECPSVPSEIFYKLIGYHRQSIHGIAFVNSQSPSNYHNADALWVSVCLCENMRYLSLIGYYLEEIDLLTIATKYTSRMKKFLVTKNHIVRIAEATNYLIPVSDVKTIEKSVSKVLCRPWKLMKTFKQPTLYYTDGKDNDIFF